MSFKSPELSEFRRSSRLQPLRRRSRSAAVIDLSAVTNEPTLGQTDRHTDGWTDGRPTDAWTPHRHRPSPTRGCRTVTTRRPTTTGSGGDDRTTTASQRPHRRWPVVTTVENVDSRPTTAGRRLPGCRRGYSDAGCSRCAGGAAYATR